MKVPDFSTSNTWYTYSRASASEDSIANWKIALSSRIVYTIFSNIAYENDTFITQFKFSSLVSSLSPFSSLNWVMKVGIIFISDVGKKIYILPLGVKIQHNVTLELIHCCYSNWTVLSLGKIYIMTLHYL
jgi:hypothetical protein